MYNRLHHQRIESILAKMNSKFLHDSKCFFGGGTAIALLLDEYRESIDIDFLCSDQEGYRKLRQSIFDHGLDELFPEKIKTFRDLRADRDGIRSVLSSEDGMPIKFEIVRESRINLTGIRLPNISVPCLSKEDMFAEKILANADRYLDKSSMSRDIIDILVMENYWGKIPSISWDKSINAYGNSVFLSFEKSKKQIHNDVGYLNRCIGKMGINKDIANIIKESLVQEFGKPKHRSCDFR